MGTVEEEDDTGSNRIDYKQSAMVDMDENVKAP